MSVEPDKKRLQAEFDEFKLRLQRASSPRPPQELPGSRGDEARPAAPPPPPPPPPRFEIPGDIEYDRHRFLARPSAAPAELARLEAELRGALAEGAAAPHLASGLDPEGAPPEAQRSRARWLLRGAAAMLVLALLGAVAGLILWGSGAQPPESATMETAPAEDAATAEPPQEDPAKAAAPASAEAPAAPAKTIETLVNAPAEPPAPAPKVPIGPRAAAPSATPSAPSAVAPGTSSGAPGEAAPAAEAPAPAKPAPKAAAAPQKPKPAKPKTADAKPKPADKPAKPKPAAAAAPAAPAAEPVAEAAPPPPAPAPAGGGDPLSYLKGAVNSVTGVVTDIGRKATGVR